MDEAKNEARPSTDENAMTEYYTKNYFMRVSIFSPFSFACTERQYFFLFKYSRNKLVSLDGGK